MAYGIGPAAYDLPIVRAYNAEQKAEIRKAVEASGGMLFLMDDEVKLAVAEGRAQYAEHLGVPIITWLDR